MASDNRDRDDIRDVGDPGSSTRNPGRNVTLPTSSSGPNVSFPSGSQFQQTNSRPPTSPTAKISRVCHITQPPQDVELMETSVPGEGTVMARPDLEQDRGNVGMEIGPARSCGLDLEPGGSNIGVDLGMDDNDVMDALFGEDARGGEAFGFDGAHDSPRIQPSDGGRLKKLGQTDRIHAYFSHIHVARWKTNSEEELGQESGDMNDSNILPGTPPSKKVSPSLHMLLYICTIG